METDLRGMASQAVGQLHRWLVWVLGSCCGSLGSEQRTVVQNDWLHCYCPW